MLHWFLALFSCSHAAMYRERRTVNGQKDVPCLVCPRCDYAVPVLTRTPKERRAFGRIVPAHSTMKARRQAAGDVVPMRRVVR